MSGNRLAHGAMLQCHEWILLSTRLHSHRCFAFCWPILFLHISISGKKDKMMDRESDGLTVRMQNGVIWHSPCGFRRLSDTVQTSCTVLMAEIWSGCLCRSQRKNFQDLYLCIKSIKMERPITTCCRSHWIVCYAQMYCWLSISMHSCCIKLGSLLNLQLWHCYNRTRLDRYIF